ncbi:MAG: DUF2235 domain-containing protein [Rhodobacteraceae bacterium]|nr:DUF2235 domain-containing protein [Paracoccaceae bacterium]NNK67840.1 DUF2235 domain-containing protein [Paracoccaceae bacterium]
MAVLTGLLRRAMSRFGRVEISTPHAVRGPRDHVIIIDGTMSSLQDGYETNAGITYKLLCEASADSAVAVRYEAGIQWQTWRSTLDVIEGRGINRQIRRVYGYLASRYRPGDRIFLFGYSRGAYAVRSLAGIIDRVGLLTAKYATERNIRLAYRYYERAATSNAARIFRASRCHREAPIEMVGVWDTVKALGFQAPLVWRWTERAHAFHNHALGASIRHGYHALALDENRVAYEPVMWDCSQDWPGHVEQIWFRGSHGDVGGQLSGFHAARPLANIPLTWMLEKAEMCGLTLPDDWQSRYPTDPTAPAAGTLRGWSKFFWRRKKRRVGLGPSEALHPTAERPTDDGGVLGWMRRARPVQ